MRTDGVFVIIWIQFATSIPYMHYATLLLIPFADGVCIYCGPEGRVGRRLLFTQKEPYTIRVFFMYRDP